MPRSFGHKIPVFALILMFLLLAAPRVSLAQDEPAAQAAQVTDGAEEEEMDLFALLIKGGWVMVPILVASVLALTLTIERFISLRKIRIIPPNFVPGLKALYSKENGDPDKSLDYCKNNPCVMGNLIKASLPKVPRGEKALEHALEEAGAREVDRMKRSLKPLSMIATISPLLGLLGTVYGMISAFQAASGAGVGKSDVLAKGIYEALVTTAAGLTLAIPVLIVYLILSNRIDNMVDDLDENAEAFMAFALEPAAEKA